jgi:integrase
MPIQRTPGTGRGGWCLSASRIIQTHQLVGAVFNYAANAGLATKNIAAEINRHDLPETRKAEQRYLTHPQLPDLAEEMGRFETLTLVLGYCGCRFGEAAALRRKDVGDREITVRASATYVAGQGSWKRTARPNGRVAYRCLNLSGNA